MESPHWRAGWWRLEVRSCWWAASLGQAKLAFGHTKWFLRDIFRQDPKLWRVIEHSHECRIEDRETGATIRAIGSDPRRAHGLAPVLVIADEPAQWPVDYGTSPSAMRLHPLCVQADALSAPRLPPTGHSARGTASDVAAILLHRLASRDRQHAAWSVTPWRPVAASQLRKVRGYHDIAISMPHSCALLILLRIARSYGGKRVLCYFCRRTSTD